MVRRTVVWIKYTLLSRSGVHPDVKRYLLHWFDILVFIIWRMMISDRLLLSCAGLRYFCSILWSLLFRFLFLISSPAQYGSANIQDILALFSYSGKKWMHSVHDVYTLLYPYTPHRYLQRARLVVSPCFQPDVQFASIGYGKCRFYFIVVILRTD